MGQQSLDVVSRNVPQDNFSANIVVLNTTHSGPTSMSDVIEWYKNGILSTYPEAIFYSDTVTTVKNVEVGMVLYSINISGSLIKTRELLFIRYNRDVQIIFTDLDSYFDSRTEFEETAASLDFFD
ncbi:MAG: hypothetical protein ACYTEU_07980 [Planctomycetota bacterium]|jgi:hypothetical protein